jgi:predicted HTH domain antitoxin
MDPIIEVDCPRELLLGLHFSREDFSRLLKRHTALMLFKEGRISSGMAARWLEIPRTQFILMAMEAGAELLEDSEDDFQRETSLL